MHVTLINTGLLLHCCLILTSAVPVAGQYLLSLYNNYIPEQENEYVLPIFDSSPSGRMQEIQTNRAGYLYGAPLLGNTSVFPTGVLGDEMVQKHKAMWYQDVQYVTEQVTQEIHQVSHALSKKGGLQNLSSFSILYEDQWQSTIPTGVDPGTLTNFSDDRLFSMERLSINPYVVQRIHPTANQLPFDVPDAVVQQLANGNTARDLHQAGRLFVADHSIQANYETNPERFTGACTALFFLHPSTQEFLPLAIRVHPESQLIYTPRDEEHDWTFAKMAFGMNDLFHGQIFHLAASHDVAEALHQAALRTMSSRHPVRAYLDRIMYRAYAVRPVGDEVLFNDGGFFDQVFALQNKAGRQYAAKLYHSAAGHFRSMQFHTDLVKRGLLECTYGPPLPHLPFLEDVEPMIAVLREFASTFVHTYYPSNMYLAQDPELQAWIVEANDAARVLDFFPSPLSLQEDLVSILTHVAFLTGIGHHIQNSLTPGASAGLLPMHPSKFKKPLPERKGEIQDLVAYIANETEAIMHASLLVRFNRPLLQSQDGNLVNMWSGQDFLGGGRSCVRYAAEKFRQDMLQISDQIRNKRFDKNGLSQGMPFIWRSLDPRLIPYYLSV